MKVYQKLQSLIILVILCILSVFNFDIYAANVTAGTSNYNISASSAGGTSFTSADNLTVQGWGNPTYTLTSNVQCVNLTLSQSARISMNGYTLTITGNLVIDDNNSMQIELGNGGQLIVTGNATIGSSCGITGTGSCLFQVGGASLMANFNNTFITLGASGTLKVAGNLTVGSTNTVTIGTLEMNGCGQNMDVSSAFSVSTFKQSSSCGTTITRSGGTSTITVTTYDQNNNSNNIKPSTNFTISGSTINPGSVTYTATTTGKWNTGSTWVGGVAPSASTDSIVIPAGITVYLDGTRSCKAIKVIGANAKIDVSNSSNGGWPNQITATNLYLDEGGALIQGSDYWYTKMIFTNVYIGVNNTSNVTSSFTLNKATDNGLQLTISSTLQVGLCSGQGSATFTYSANIYGANNPSTLTIANRIIYPNGTYTYSGTGGSVPSNPSTVTKMPCIRTWNGGGGDNNFSTAANWGGTAPTGGEDLVFAGSTRLSPSNNLTAGTSFNSIKFSSGAGNFSLSGNSITIKGGDTAVIANNTTGTMTIGNNITFSTLAPTISTTSGGTLAFSGTIANGGYLITNSSAGTTTFSGVISGSGAFTKSGAGTTTFSAANTYSGTATTISAGTLKLGASGVIPDASAVTVTGTLDMNTFSETVGSIAGAGTIDNASGAGTPTLSSGGDNSSTTFSGIIKNTTGTLSLTKTGTGALTLQGNNTFSGTLTISGGSVVAENTNAMGSTSAGTTVSSGTQLVLKASTIAAEPLTITGTYDNGSFPYALRNSTSYSTVSFPGNITLAGNSTIGSYNSGDNFTLSGVISGSYNLTTSGSGTTILSGTNTYTGSTTISAGKLKLGAAGVIPNSSAVTVTGTLDLNTYSETVGSLAGAGTIDNVSGGGTPTLSFGGDNSTTTFSGTIKNTTGTLSVTKTGSGTQTFSGGSNIIYGGASSVQAGTLKLVDPTSLASGSSTASFDISSGAVLEFNSNSQNVYLGSTCTGGTVITGTGTLRKTGTFSLELGGFQGSSSYKVYLNMTDGTIDIQAGTLKNGGWQCGIWTSNKADLNIASGATVDVWDGNTIYVDALTGAGSLTKTDTYSSSNTVIVGVNNGSGSFTGNITESSSSYKIVLTKQGSGTQTLSGTNTYSGGTNLTAGQLNINSTTALGTGTFTIANGTVIDNTSGGSITLSNNNAQTWNGDFTFTGSNALNLGIGAVAMGSSLRTITTTASTLTVGGTISGTGGLTKAGAGTMTLGGIAANNWSGPTTISAGTFNLGTQNGNDYYQSTSWTVSSGATLVSASSNVIINSAVMTINTGGTWNMNNKAEAIGYLAGGGNITNLGTSTTDGFEIDLPATGTGSNFSGVISGIGQVKIRGGLGSGKQIFSGLNTFTGQTLIQNGTLSINTIKSVGGGSSAIGAPTTSAAGTIDMGSSSSTGILEYTGSAQTTDRIINLAGTTGGGTIDQSGTGLLKFTSNFTTASTAKTLTLQGSTAGTGEISGTIFSGSTNVSLVKSGSGTWTNSGTSSYNNVTVSAGTLAESANTVNVAGNFSNSATFTPSTSTIIMSGTAAQTISAANFYNLTINNTSGGVSLTGDINVSNNLTLTSGILTTSTYIADLGSTGSISEINPSATNPSSYVTGYVRATRNLLQNVTNTFGGIGVSLTESTQVSNSTVVTRRTGTASVGAGNQSILRYFDITPNVDANLNGTMVFSYIDAELNGQAEDSLKIYKSTNSGSTWAKQASSSVNTGSNSLSLSGITSFSRWTASNKVSNPLPVEFISFTATKGTDATVLKWETAQEINNDYFEIERSHDGINFEKINSIKGVGTTNSISNYSYVDKSTNQTLATYYRLKQVDFDKKSEYSNIVFVNGSIGHKDFHLYPNPLEEGNKLYACLGDDDEGIIKVSVFDMSGKLLQDFLIDNVETGSNITLENENLLLPKGMYIIEIKSIHNDYKQKLEVK